MNLEAYLTLIWLHQKKTKRPHLNWSFVFELFPPVKTHQQSTQQNMWSCFPATPPDCLRWPLTSFFTYLKASEFQDVQLQTTRQQLQFRKSGLWQQQQIGHFFTNNLLQQKSMNKSVSKFCCTRIFEFGYTGLTRSFENKYISDNSTNWVVLRGPSNRIMQTFGTHPNTQYVSVNTKSSLNSRKIF